MAVITSHFGRVAHESSLRQFLEDGDAHFPSGFTPDFSSSTEMAKGGQMCDRC